MLEKFKKASKKSKVNWERALQVFPGGISHNLRTFGLDRLQIYPPFMERGEGCHLWDLDGNEYIDYWMTHFSLILGHNNPRVREAISEQLDKGWHFGTLNEPQIKFGEMLQEAIPQMKRMRFSTTGSESTMYATRLCKLFTGKRLVGKVRGGWHGGNDALGYHLKYPFNDPPFFDGVSFEFNDRDSFDVLLKSHGKKLAAIIIEPVLGAGGGLAPEPNFLPYIREETAARDILLIFDEIITGFRLCFGAAGTKVFSVEPDLFTLGKIAAGGMPLGVYGGREDIMALAAPSTPGGRWVGGGTFSCHPLSMVAGMATLQTLKAKQDEYILLNNRSNQFRGEINQIFEQEKINAMATGEGSIVFIHLLKHAVEDLPITASKIGEAFDKEQTDLLQAKLIEEGIFGYHGLGALSFAHTEADLKQTLEIIQKITPLLSPHS